MEELCRTCGEIPQNSDLRYIFKEIVLLKLIKEFTGLQLKNKEKHPVYICNRCNNMLKEMFNFKQRCILVQNFFNYRISKDAKSTKVQNKTNEIDPPADSLIDNESEKYLSDDIDSDRNLSIDSEDSDEEEKYKQQKDLVGQHEENYNSTQESSDEVGNGENDEMETYLNEIEPFDKDAADNVDAIDMNSDKEQSKSNERNCICEICGKMFTSNNNLKQHRFTHNTVKAFKCSHCNKAYNTSTELKKHERVHTESHPYVCSYCSEKFSYASAKIRHEKIHTNERPHKCSYCEKTFIESCALKNHETTHTRIRKYHCDICGHWALTRSHLRIHSRTKAHKLNELEHNQRLQKNQLDDSKQLPDI